MDDVKYKANEESLSLTPLAKLLMGLGVYESTKNITHEQFKLLTDPLIHKQFNITYTDLIESIISHGLISTDDIYYIVAYWPTRDSWETLFGVEVDRELSDNEIYDMYPEILDFYRLKFRLLLSFPELRIPWSASIKLSEDVENDIRIMIKNTTTLELGVYLNNARRGEGICDMSFTEKLIELFNDNDKFAQYIKLTNPDLTDILRSN